VARILWAGLPSFLNRNHAFPIVFMRKYLVYLLLALVSLGGTSACKSKKKAAEKAAQEAAAKAAAELKQKRERAKTELQALLNDDSKSIEDKEAAIARIKGQNLNDPEVNALIEQLEGKLAVAKTERAKKMEEERLAREAEEERKRAEATPLNQRLINFFDRIASAPNREEANRLIEQAMQLFASPKVPVLRIIGVFNGQKDYDRPTDIEQYLNYLKDQKKSQYKLQTFKTDASGKVSELELITNK
jgi:hypothetical protein